MPLSGKKECGFTFMTYFQSDEAAGLCVSLFMLPSVSFVRISSCCGEGWNEMCHSNEAKTI